MNNLLIFLIYVSNFISDSSMDMEALIASGTSAEDVMEDVMVSLMDDNQLRFICKKCGVKYKKMGPLKSHLRECGTGAKCPLCPKIVTQRRNLRKHMEIHKRDGSYEDDDRMKFNDNFSDYSMNM